MLPCFLISFAAEGPSLDFSPGITNLFRSKSSQTQRVGGCYIPGNRAARVHVSSQEGPQKSIRADRDNEDSIRLTSCVYARTGATSKSHPNALRSPGA